MTVMRLLLTLNLCVPAAVMAAYLAPEPLPSEISPAIAAETSTDTAQTFLTANFGQDPLQRELSATLGADAEAAKKFDVRFALSTHHPNERHRLYAQVATADGRLSDALKFFRIAARYADKYSQLRLALIYWQGTGVAQDRVEAYLWADLAAERGYPMFLAVREQMWKKLTPEQQAAALRRGPAIHAEFGDAVAKQRFKSKLARSATRGQAKRMAGIMVRPGKALRGAATSREELEAWALAYAPSRIEAERYWVIEDRIMTKGLGSDVTVTVGDIEQTAPAKPEFHQLRFKRPVPMQPKQEPSGQEPSAQNPTSLPR
jgi:uncharacterized protein